MKHVINRNGIRLNYTQEFIEKGKPSFINELDWNVIETNLQPNYSFIKNKWNGSEWIEGLTPQEIAEHQEQQKENFVREFMEKKRQDGKSYASDVRFRITKELIGRPIAEVNEIDSQCKQTVMPLLQLIEGEGADFWTAMNLALETQEPLNLIALSYFNEVKGYILNYVQTNYPKEL